MVSELVSGNDIIRLAYSELRRLSDFEVDVVPSVICDECGYQVEKPKAIIIRSGKGSVAVYLGERDGLCQETGLFAFNVETDGRRAGAIGTEVGDKLRSSGFSGAILTTDPNGFGFLDPGLGYEASGAVRRLLDPINTKSFATDGGAAYLPGLASEVARIVLEVASGSVIAEDPGYGIVDLDNELT